MWTKESPPKRNPVRRGMMVCKVFHLLNGWPFPKMLPHQSIRSPRVGTPLEECQGAAEWKQVWLPWAHNWRSSDHTVLKPRWSDTSWDTGDALRGTTEPRIHIHPYLKNMPSAVRLWNVHDILMEGTQVPQNWKEPLSSTKYWYYSHISFSGRK